MPKLPQSWNSTSAEEADHYVADDFAVTDAQRFIRAVTVEAPADTTYRWLCQLRVAPYSYDLLDNWGRRSPRTLTPGADGLEVGQRFVEIARIVAFEPGRHVTSVILPRPARLFGDLVMTYQVTPIGEDRSRLVCCICVGGGSPVALLRRYLLGWGDLVMMRKQLLTLKGCAEATAGAVR